MVTLCLQGQLVAGFKYAAHGVDTKEVCSCRPHLSFVPHAVMCTCVLLLSVLCAVRDAVLYVEATTASAAEHVP